MKFCHCNECKGVKVKDELVPHPCDRNQEVLVCKECAILIEDSYEFQEVISGRAIERELELCL